ncbi:hypothetical protein [Emticicia sp. SJ17W-69]|uniref:hypothetical protein n=1 Tax=Emticicia sp. SJ17W-69 TaxID=3421657 RepID=UPI003EBF3D1C
MDNNANTPHLISYLYLRRAVGFLGFALPIILVLGSVLIGNCQEIQSSISSYYHTLMRDVFVGTLCAIALFLFSYKGYANDKRDNIAGTFASFFAIGVAFFPTAPDMPLPPCDSFLCNIPSVITNPFISKLHFVFATLFFLVLTYFSLVLFTETKNKKTQTEQKKQRNRIYRICGYIMLVCIILIAIYFFVLEKKYPDLAKYTPVFWLETIALWAFATSWLIKGELLLKDK